MKKTFVMMVVMLSTVTTHMVAAQSKFAISNLPISVIESGSADNKIVNISGMTGNQVKNLLDAWCKERAGITLHQLVTEGTKAPITVSHGNCESLPSGLHAYYDIISSSKYNGDAWMWAGSALIKDDCCNLVASSDGVIANFLKSYFSQNQGQGSGTVINPGSGQLGQQKENNNKNETMDVNVNFKGLESVAQQTNYGPWWLWLIGAIVLIALALIFRPGNRQRFIASLRDGWAVEDEVLERDRRRVRDADAFQSERNGFLHRESEAQRNRYRAQ